MIYFAQEVETKNIKIGRTENLPARLSSIQTNNSSFIRFIGAVHESGISEKEYKDMFKDYRIRGEWFRCEGLLKEMIEELRRN